MDTKKNLEKLIVQTYTLKLKRFINDINNSTSKFDIFNKNNYNCIIYICKKYSMTRFNEKSIDLSSIYVTIRIKL